MILLDRVEWYRDEFIKISDAEPETLSLLITQMEKEFGIPPIRCEKYAYARPEVIKLYREILAKMNSD